MNLKIKLLETKFKSNLEQISNEIENKIIENKIQTYLKMKFK
jgi:hypothetical protein